MTTWLLNVVTGRFLHWNEANNTYASELLQRAKQFPPAIEPLFTQFTASSYSLVKLLVGPDEGSRRIIKKDVKKITPKQFKSLHNIHIWTFMALFGNQNPQFRDPSFAACKDFIGIQENEKQMVAHILQMNEITSLKIGSKLFPEITKILNYQDEAALDWTTFAQTFLFAYSQAMEAYWQAMKKLS